MRNFSQRMIVSTLTFCAVCVGTVFADYEVVDVKDGGTIVGKVRFEGTLPKETTVKVSGTDAPCHAKPIPNDEIVVSKKGGLRWVVIRIQAVRKGKPFAQIDPKKLIVLDQRGCRFSPHIVLVPQHQPLKILNSDGILHHVRFNARRNQPLDQAMPAGAKEIEITLDRPERIPVSCDVHPWAAAWVVVARHPYYTVTDENGTFRFENVPPGTYTLQAWHEKLGRRAQQGIVVPPGGEAKTEFVMGE